MVVLLLKTPIGGWALPLAGGLFVAGTLGGLLWGAFKRTPVAGCGPTGRSCLGLEDRVATALEWAGRPDRTPLVDALVTDAIARIDKLEPRVAARRVIPRDGRFLPIPLALAVILALAPPVPLPSGRLPDFSADTEDATAEPRTDSSLLEDRKQPLAKDRMKSPSFEERDFASKMGGTGAAMSGDLSAIFKDTALSSQRPDFQSFLKKGDERLKLLEQADRLPDLQSDFTTSQYKMVFNKSKALSSGLRPDQISPQKLTRAARGDGAAGAQGRRQLAGRCRRGHGGAGGRPARSSAGGHAAGSGQDARPGRGLGARARGSRAAASNGPAPALARSSRRRGRRARGPGLRRGRGDAARQGPERLAEGRGDAAAARDPYDVGVEGESRRGRKDGFDTNLTGRAGRRARACSTSGSSGSTAR